MKLTVLGGCGAYPRAGHPCSGYLVEHEGFRLLVDPGYGTMPELPDPVRVDAVLVSHCHPDHCADLNPLLRARVLRDEPAAPLPVYAPPGALDRVLALEFSAMLDDAHIRHEIVAGRRCEIGPFTLDAWSLPHFVPNIGVRLTADGRTLSYTGDSGPCAELEALARDADLYLAEATYALEVPARDAAYLSSAGDAGATATRAGVGQLLLTHLWPGSDPRASASAALTSYQGPVDVARPGLVVEVTGHR